MPKLWGMTAAAQQPDPEFLTPELAERWQEVKQLMAANARSEQELATYGARLDPAAILTARFQVFLDMVWPGDTVEGQEARLEHDERCQRMFAQSWQQIKSQVIQQRLAAGGQVAPGMMEQMAGQQGIGPGLLRGNGGRRSRKT